MQRSFLRYVWLMGILALLNGCAGQQINAPIPELAALPETGAQMQHLTFEHQRQRHQLIGVLRHDERSLRLALLNPQGQRLLTLVYDDDGARFLADTSFAPPFSAEWLASRLSWSLWPSAALIRTFDQSDWALVENGERRTILHDKRTIARITGDTDCRIIQDFEADYRLYIAPLNDDTNRTTAPCPTD